VGLLDDLRKLFGGGDRGGAAPKEWSSAPVWDGDLPDPFVLPVSDGYLAFGTNAGGRNVQVLHSPDLAGWTLLPDALPTLAPWVASGFTWAPVVLPRQGGHVLYVCVRHRASGRQAITVATGADPAGPYTDSSDGPLVFQEALGGSIDPSPFVDADGMAYLLWKADANAIQQPSSLWAQPLSDDGLHLLGEPSHLVDFGGGWERPLVEAPSMARADDGSYVLWYSGGWWESAGYAVGYATGPHPLGPWRKVTAAAPWLASDSTVAGPGGQETFVDHGGQRWLAYHGWAPGHTTYATGGARRLHLVRITLAPDGTPRLA
jgi:beta-xylosidase